MTNMGWTLGCPGQAGKFVKGCADETGAVQTEQAVLESAAPMKLAKSEESAAGADDESGRFIVLGLTKKTGGLNTHWAVAAMPTVGKIGRSDLCTWRPVGENWQSRFFDEHGLSRPGRKIRQRDALTK